ncbi:MAG: hypothetical protein K6B40_04395 [Firmicutes bacterium]|nr:hypothetical protein [Bacillota bacterium]
MAKNNILSINRLPVFFPPFPGGGKARGGFSFFPPWKKAAAISRISFLRGPGALPDKGGIGIPACRLWNRPVFLCSTFEISGFPDGSVKLP